MCKTRSDSNRRRKRMFKKTRGIKSFNNIEIHVKTVKT